MGQHYNISIQELKTVFPHGLPPRFVMQVLKTGGFWRELVTQGVDSRGVELNE